MASCPTGVGQQKHRKFPVAEYGERGARAKAVEVRRRALKVLSRIAFLPGRDRQVARR